MNDTEKRIIGCLLAGGTIIFGKPIGITWPEGLPPGWTAEELGELGRKMQRETGTGPQWVRADDLTR